MRKSHKSSNWRFYLRWMIWPRITAPFKAIGHILSCILTVYRVAFLLTAIAVALWYFNRIDIDTLLPNIVTDLLGVALTVFIIDKMYRLRSDVEQKKILIAKLGSKNNAVASAALRELSAQGWLSDGTLLGAHLTSCNLDGNSFSGADLRRVSLSYASLQDTQWFETDLRDAFLDHAMLCNASLSMHDGPYYPEANLTGATLSHADLSKARVRHEQLCRLRSLWRATMPDGQIYDGRYNLSEDIHLYLKFARNPNNPQEWAEFYGVSLDKYLEGQAWASTNPDLSQQAVLKT
ncbi:MAG: pentapeptide repeat-containing protein [Anaerolineae bacterium]|nr:pentapeptide repeat-containing protein [Anaerolineae bacterium]